MAIDSEIKEAIEKALPAGRVFFDFGDRTDYTRDAVEQVFIPDALFFAESETEIIRALELCRKLELPLIVRGAGTGYSGGALAARGGLVVSIERMDRLEIDPEDKTALVGPGTITAAVLRAAEKHGLFYPPDPASYEESTIAGNLAENAGGLRGKKYGVTGDYVLGFRGILPNGQIIAVDQQTPFGLNDVLVGSEGTLIIFTEIKLRLIDKPETGRTIQAVFDDAVDAARSISKILSDGIVPCIMEYMDGDAIECSNQYDPDNKIPEGAAMVLFETDGPLSDSDADHILSVCRARKPKIMREAASTAERDLLWRTRRNLSRAVKNAYVSKIAEDVCVPPSRLPDLVAYVAELNNSFNVRVNCYGHAGDGNLHVNFLGATGSHAENEEIERGVDLLFRKTLELGGTLSGEHGIGITKSKYLPLEFNTDTLVFMKRLKDGLDPEGILNPGKIFI